MPNKDYKQLYCYKCGSQSCDGTMAHTDGCPFWKESHKNK